MINNSQLKRVSTLLARSLICLCILSAKSAYAGKLSADKAIREALPQFAEEFEKNGFKDIKWSLSQSSCPDHPVSYSYFDRKEDRWIKCCIDIYYDLTKDGVYEGYPRDFCVPPHELAFRKLVFDILRPVLAPFVAEERDRHETREREQKERIALYRNRHFSHPPDPSSLLLVNHSKHRDYEKVESLLAQRDIVVDQPLDEKSCFGWTALTFASSHNHLAAIKMLLERGADPLHVTFAGETPLEEAAIRGHTDAFSLMEGKLRKENRLSSPEYQKALGAALLYAADKGNLKEVKRLLKIPTIDVQYRNPLLRAVRQGWGFTEGFEYTLEADRKEIVSRLLAAGADPLATDPEGISSLREAARRGLFIVFNNMANALKDKPEALSSPEFLNSLQIALWVAVEKADLGQVERILSFPGIQVDQVHDRHEWTPLMRAVKTYSCTIQSNSLEIIRALLKAGANPLFSVGDNEETPLLVAAKRGEFLVVQEFEKHLGRSLDGAPSKEAIIAAEWNLGHEAWNGDIDKITYWLKSPGVHVDARSSERMATPLRSAIFGGKGKAALFLLQHGADPTVVYSNEDVYYEDLETLAAKRGLPEVAQAIREWKRAHALE